MMHRYSSTIKHVFTNLSEMATINARLPIPGQLEKSKGCLCRSASCWLNFRTACLSVRAAVVLCLWLSVSRDNHVAASFSATFRQAILLPLVFPLYFSASSIFVRGAQPSLDPPASCFRQRNGLPARRELAPNPGHDDLWFTLIRTDPDVRPIVNNPQSPACHLRHSDLP